MSSYQDLLAYSFRARLVGFTDVSTVSMVFVLFRSTLPLKSGLNK